MCLRARPQWGGADDASTPYLSAFSALFETHASLDALRTVTLHDGEL